MYNSLSELEEASSIVITRLINKIDYFDDKRSPLPFIVRSMKNHSIDEFRKRTKRQAKEKEAAAKKTTVSFLEEDVEGLLSLYREDLLTREEDEVFSLTYQKGMSPEQVKRELSLSDLKYRKYLSSIKKKFSEALV